MITIKRTYKCDFCDNTIETVEREMFIESQKCTYHELEPRSLIRMGWVSILGRLACDKHVIKVDNNILEVGICE